MLVEAIQSGILLRPERPMRVFMDSSLRLGYSSTNGLYAGCVVVYCVEMAPKLLQQGLDIQVGLW